MGIFHLGNIPCFLKDSEKLQKYKERGNILEIVINCLLFIFIFIIKYDCDNIKRISFSSLHFESFSTIAAVTI